MTVKRVRVTRRGEILSLDACGITIPLTIDEAEALMDDLSAAQLAARRVAWQSKQAEAEAARLAAQASQPWGLWSGGRDERGELVHMGVSYPTNIVDTLPLAEAQRRRDEHNAALTHGDEGAGQ